MTFFLFVTYLSIFTKVALCDIWQVSKKVEVRVQTLEDIWAVKFINFIICANQLLFDGLTREIPM